MKTRDLAPPGRRNLGPIPPPGLVKASDFDYSLPPHLIAQTPMEPRNAARLMVLHRAGQRIEHRTFRDLPEYLRSGDLLVANDSRVIAARLWGRKAATGGRVEVLLVRQVAPDVWEALVRPGRRVREGTKLVFRVEGRGERGGGTASTLNPLPSPLNSLPSPLYAEVVGQGENGTRQIRFFGVGDTEAALEALGTVPLPPYIRQPLQDPERYQTVYARIKGSVAAPTAGLHFTPELMERLRQRGVQWIFVTLHIGPATFRPVRAEEVERHRLQAEYGELGAAAAEEINRAKAQGRRIIAVGTTAVRVLETAAIKGLGERVEGLGERIGGLNSLPSPLSPLPSTLYPHRGWTDLFIYPGFAFRVVDGLITNFHLPRSSLLMLVAAFAGREFVLEAYRIGIERGYRFYSFGDCMIIL